MITMSQPSHASDESVALSSSAGSTDRNASQSRPPKTATLTPPRIASETQGTQVLQASPGSHGSERRFWNWNWSFLTWLFRSGSGSGHLFKAPQYIPPGTILFG